MTSSMRAACAAVIVPIDTVGSSHPHEHRVTRGFVENGTALGSWRLAIS